MELFEIPSQGKAQYIYTRLQPVMAAAFPEFAKHFEIDHYLYVPGEPDVSIDYRPWWHPMELNIREFTTGFPPPPIRYFEFEGQADTDRPDPRGRVAVRNGMIDLDNIRKRVEEVRKKAALQIQAYQEQESNRCSYTIALTPAEIVLLEGAKEQCRCGHLGAFHVWDEDYSRCEVHGCQGCSV